MAKRKIILMPIHKLISTLFLSLFLLLASGCASIFSPRYQKVKFSVADKDATISYNGDSLGRGNAQKKLDKNMLFHTVTINKDGYIPKSYGFELGKKFSASILFALLDLPGLILAPPFIIVDLIAPRTHRFAKKYEVPAPTEFKKHKPDEKYLLLDKNPIEDIVKNVNIHQFSSIRNYDKDVTSQEYQNPINEKMERVGINEIGPEIVKELNNALISGEFVDTTKHLFPNMENTLFLKASIKNMTINEFSRNPFIVISQDPNELVSVYLEIEWQVLDYYRQPIFTTTTKITSDMYSLLHLRYNYRKGQKPHANLTGTKVPMQSAISNNILRSLLALRATITEKGLMKTGGQGNDTLNIITIARPIPPGKDARLNEVLKSTVSIKTDGGHGSGVIISEDGYIVTNYHVVAGAKSIEVIFNDEKKIIARVVRSSTSGDLTLLKVDKDSLNPLPLHEQKTPEIGVDVWAIGTPNSLELGQTVSRGIISSIRASENMSYIQTDVKISPGNSGGALINRNGDVLGIVSAKIIGFGTEGIGFAITSYQVLEKLKIAYK